MSKDDRANDEIPPSNSCSQVGGLLQHLDYEIRSNKIYNGYIEQLQALVTNKENSRLKGLEEKLDDVGRYDELDDALSDLMMFEMVLDKFTHYQSAQKLFFYFMARILSVFRNKIMPRTANLSREETEEIIENDIIKPTIREMDQVGGHAELLVTELEVRGMINWLAERCHVRWKA